MTTRNKGDDAAQRVVLVTGGRGRIGGAIARALVARGDVVVVVDRVAIPKKQAGNRTRRRSQDARLVHFQADLAMESQTRRVFRTVLRRYGRIDAAVLAAGDFVYGPFLTQSASDWDRLFRNNVLTAFLCLQELARTMPKAGGGRVVVIGSIVDHRAVRGNAVYGSSKAALRMLGDIVREEMRDSSLRITNLCLGAVASPMARLMKGTSTQSLLDPAVVVNAVLWLLESPPESRFDELKLFPPVGVNDP